MSEERAVLSGEPLRAMFAGAVREGIEIYETRKRVRGMNEARKRQAEDFAREVMGDEVLRDGFAALLEGLEWMAFQRWRQTESGEGWRQISGELAAIRQMGQAVRTVGGVKHE